ncbi:MAG TPA: ABC transporter permease [Candidatus Eremiobacteraceae bacterium]|nr:ABC transporter permease [Candidatus Eremiobacteraceae bacterium]
MDPLMPLLAIASLTLREAARRRVILAVGLLSLLVIGLSGWGFERLHAMSIVEGRPSPSQAAATYAILVIMLAQMFSFVLAVGAAFLAAPSIAGEVESGVALVVLPRPIRRSDVLLGKWLGLSVLLALYAFGAGGLELIVVRLITGYVPPHPIVALGFIAFQAIALLTLALALSTRLASITGGIIALVLYGVSWLAQPGSTAAAIFHNEGLQHACTAITLLVPTGGLWRGAAFALEPVLIAAMSGTTQGANPITVSTPPTGPFLIWSAGWIVAVLLLGIWSFNKRDV